MGKEKLGEGRETYIYANLNNNVLNDIKNYN